MKKSMLAISLFIFCLVYFNAHATTSIIMDPLKVKWWCTFYCEIPSDVEENPSTLSGPYKMAACATSSVAAIVDANEECKKGFPNSPGAYTGSGANSIQCVEIEPLTWC